MAAHSGARPGYRMQMNLILTFFLRQLPCVFRASDRFMGGVHFTVHDRDTDGAVELKRGRSPRLVEDALQRAPQRINHAAIDISK